MTFLKCCSESKLLLSNKNIPYCRLMFMYKGKEVSIDVPYCLKSKRESNLEASKMISGISVCKTQLQREGKRVNELGEVLL